MWYGKMYFSGKHEFFQYDPSGVQRVPSVWKEQPFLESLLTFLEMDCAELIPVIRQITDSWESMLTRDDKNASLDAMKGLGLLGSKHIYLYLLYVRWYDRLTRIGIYHDQGSPEDQQIILEAAQESTDSHKILWEEAINDAVEEAKNEMGVEFVEDVDKDAFREATKGMIEDYCERYPGVAELLDIIESVK